MSEQERYTGRVFGDVEVDRNAAELVVTARERGSLPVHGCLFLLFSMGCILLLGMMAVVSQSRFDAHAGHFFAPRSNQLGFLWLFSTVGMFLVVPLYLRRVYGATVTTTFSRTQRIVSRNGRPVTRFEKIECLQLRERRDPDGRFLYEVCLLHDDGSEKLLSESYDERAAMNLANEIAGFAFSQVRWR